MIDLATGLACVASTVSWVFLGRMWGDHRRVVAVAGAASNFALAVYWLGVAT